MKIHEEIELPRDPAIPLWVSIQRNWKTQKDACVPMFIAVLSVIVQMQNQPECSLMDGWICILKCYVAIKKVKSYDLYITWMDSQGHYAE